MESLPGLVEIFFGSEPDWRFPPAIGTMKISLFVLVASTSSMLLGVSQLLAIGRDRIHVLPAEMERRHVVIARREISW